MGEVDKPFGCPQPGCGMSFTNEDHLTVHRRRHEMQLTVNGDHHTSSLVKHHGYIIDQTPTPTRFLRQCEEVGLFQEINLNPFDEQFRRASLLRSHHSLTEALGGNGGESLDTPRVLPPVDSDETISSTSRDDVSVTSTTAMTTATITTSSISASRLQTTTSGCTPPQSSSRVIEVEGDLDKTEQLPRRLSLNVSSAAEASQQSSSVISTPTPVITAGPSVTQSLGVVDVAGGSVKINGLAQSSPQQPALCAAASCVPPSPSATVLQLLLRLPNGQAIPVEIPATPVVSSSNSSGTTNGTVSSIAGSLPHSVESRSPHQSLAKMKLKQALASSSTAARPGCSKISRANTADRIAEMTRSRNFSGTSSTEGEGEEDSTSGNGNILKGERRRRHSSDNEDPAEKRKKFLERNRAAAIRCREKKKKWIENLSIKYDELGSINQKLQTEVSSLRSEVAILKSMLLQHKDCPVTLAMQGDGSLDCVNCSSDLAPLPPILAPLSVGVHISGQPQHKPRTRSLSLPSIPSSSGTVMEPLPVNLSCSTYTVSPACTAVTSVSSSTKVGVIPAVSPVAASMSPVNLTNSLITTSQHPAALNPTTTSARLSQPGAIFKLSHAPLAHKHTSSPQLLIPATGASQFLPTSFLNYSPPPNCELIDSVDIYCEGC
ncbi:cyclic AMP-dependent transcription factor ATF-7-like isoform X2 [Homarus americanus]|uniref:cyclic AMP-dependent transcription factor ATF-7-like isoform X2 n=1 Tax=Homarus americanus TaxID=6706 RepID=UPI001C454E94|nr:cyclic AMP-dependent transcription factor ATF-7-like isoform X2 [Homarus americanus]